MVLSNLKSIVENKLNVAIVDCCIGIPDYFSDLQSIVMLDAAPIASLHPLHLFHETTATTLAYGIYKIDLPENDQLNGPFVDVGHASMQVCIASYKTRQLKILSHSYDQSLDGRDFDEVIFKYLATKFKIDVYQNTRACIRLRVACEKPKKVKKTNVPVKELVYGRMPAKELQKAVEKEFEMTLQNRVMEETKDKKNVMEAYMYDMRNKLYDKYKAIATSLKKDELIVKLQAVEDWLYEDGEDKPLRVFMLLNLRNFKSKVTQSRRDARSG